MRNNGNKIGVNMDFDIDDIIKTITEDLKEFKKIKKDIIKIEKEILKWEKIIAKYDSSLVDPENVDD